MKFSWHFIDNWRQRVGGAPTELLIREIIRRSVRVQSCKSFRLKNGEEYRRLALYWHPDMDVIISIDHIDQKAVSVLSRKLYEEKLRVESS